MLWVPKKWWALRNGGWPPYAFSPDPVSDHLTIDFGLVPAPITYKLRDLQGRLVSAEQGVVAPVELDVTGLASGAYSLSVHGYKPVMVVRE